MSRYTTAHMKAKLNKLLEIEGYEPTEDGLLAFMETYGTDSVVPAICMRKSCDYVEGKEPDSENGWCEECHANTLWAGTQLFMHVGGV